MSSEGCMHSGCPSRGTLIKCDCFERYIRPGPTSIKKGLARKKKRIEEKSKKTFCK